MDYNKALNLILVLRLAIHFSFFNQNSLKMKCRIIGILFFCLDFCVTFVWAQNLHNSDCSENTAMLSMDCVMVLFYQIMLFETQTCEEFRKSMLFKQKTLIYFNP